MEENLFYSFIVPVYNRPDHVINLFQSMILQSYKNFEVILIESGSTIKSDLVVKQFENKLNIHYFYKSNEGQGFSRNYGMERAKGDYFLIIDSDIVIPENYVLNIHYFLQKNKVDAFGGPDDLYPNSTPFQKAVNYCMTSIFTTGGTRGKKNVKNFQPRSFNMGVSKEVYKKTKGYNLPYKGEDLEWSKRIKSLGFKTALIPEAVVMHERKKDIKSYYKQMFWFGQSRIQIHRYFHDGIKPIHLLPLAYICGMLFICIFSVDFHFKYFQLYYLYLLYHLAICIESLIKYKNIYTSFWSTILSFVLMLAYSFGMIYEAFFIEKNTNTTDDI